MIAVDMHNVEKSYGITDVLKGFSLNVTEGERVGLIGPNGSGKTTIFRIIAGLEPYSGGEVSLKRGIKVGYLSQMPDITPENTVYQELETVFNHLLEMKERIKQLETKISHRGDNIRGQGEDDSRLDKLMQEYSQLQHRFEAEGGYKYKSMIRKIAVGLGFTLDELEKAAGKLSGGEKTRLGLVKLLLSEPELLLLDEPTNHLDIPARQWLEDYLKDYQGAVIIISHDRYFLDQVVTRIIELKHGQSETYNGNYSYYLEERERRYEQKLHAYKNQQKKIKKMKESIEQLKNWGRQGDNEKFFNRARSMEKELERMDKIEKPVLGGKKMALALDINKRSGDEVAIIKNCTKSFAAEENREEILSELNLSVYWQDKSAIIGENGTGKTTLLKMIVGEMEPDKGEIKIGTSVRVGYYSQEFAGFNPDDDLVTALRREVSISSREARDALAAFLFTEDEVFKKVGNLSGGEKSRLRLLQLTYGNYNFLVLDEPTNHLDLPSREVLEEVLQEYSGTILVVSHDRYFLNKISEYTYELSRGQLTKFYGNYDYYRQKNEKRPDTKTGNEPEAKEKNQDNYYFKKKREQREKRKKKKQVENLENRIMELETEKEELEAKMSAPENLENYELLRELENEYNAIKGKLDSLYKEWELYL